MAADLLDDFAVVDVLAMETQRKCLGGLATSSARCPIANSGGAADAEDALLVADLGLVW